MFGLKPRSTEFYSRWKENVAEVTSTDQTLIPTTITDTASVTSSMESVLSAVGDTKDVKLAVTPNITHSDNKIVDGKVMLRVQEERLREIIREELARYFGTKAHGESQQQSASIAAIKPQEVSVSTTQPVTFDLSPRYVNPLAALQPSIFPTKPDVTASSAQNTFTSLSAINGVKK